MRRFTVFLALLCLTLLGGMARAQDISQLNIPKANIDYGALKKLNVRLGIQAWTFNRYTAFETIDIISKLGVKYVELYPGQRLSKDLPASVTVGPDMSDEHLQMLKDKLKADNVTAIAFGVCGLSGNEKSDRKTFEFAKKLGLENIVSEPPPRKEVFDVIEKLCDEYQINVAMHDHPKPSTYWNPDTVLKVVEGRTKRLGSCADTGHWVRSGLVSLDCVKKLKGRIIEFHLKDIDAKHVDVPWDDGIVNARGIMAELQKQGANNQVFDIEYESSSGQQLINNVVRCCENFSKDAVELTK